MVVAPPGLQREALAGVEVRFALPPVQKVVGPEGVMTGVEGNGFTVTVMLFEGKEVHPPLLATTE